MKASYKFIQLVFKNPSGTSRGILKTKDSWFLMLEHDGQEGVGECSLIYGLSIESRELIEQKISLLCSLLNEGEEITPDFFDDCPSLLFAYETALLNMQFEEPMKYFDCDFIKGKPIPINGLIWMGEKSFMRDQIKAKIEEGFSCIKIKIAAIDFNDEVDLLKYIRTEFKESDIQIRLDANCGFDFSDASEKLKILSAYNIHSIEQPISVGMHAKMNALCQKSPIDIALDEELIKVRSLEDKIDTLKNIMPQYIILKPGLIGGIAHAEEWINEAEKLGIKWWITSALESNVGLNAIAQWTSSLNTTMPQGLGTGKLFKMNIPSPLDIKNGYLHYDPNWESIFKTDI
ncbi:MAG: o-succinylbenzoate synthase [Saprospiraceae bacterium]|nr:o-succinylbenzoate synthase [Saprospiraceae bacterium]